MLAVVVRGSCLIRLERPFAGFEVPKRVCTRRKWNTSEPEICVLFREGPLNDAGSIPAAST